MKTLLQKSIGLLFLTLIYLGLGQSLNAQTTIFNYTNTTATIPSGFVLTNNVATNAIDQSTYLLLDAGSPSDYIVTPNYDLSAYTSATLTVNVATFGSGTAYPMKIEFSTNGGTSWNATTYTTATPSSATYIAGGPIVITQTFTTTTKFRFSNNGTSGRGVRIQDLKLVASSTITSAASGNWSSTATWVGGVVPTSGSDVIIAAGHTVTMDTTTGGINTRNSGTNTTVAATATLATNVTYINNGTTTINGSFQLNSGGWVSDAGGTNGLVYGAAGTLIFNTTYTANSGNYWPTSNGPVNVTVNASSPLTLGFARTVTGVFQTSATITNPGNITIGTNGTLQLNSGYGWAGTGNPVYGSASLLKYNSGGSPGRSTEWTASSGTIGTTAGYPQNVQVSNNTTINFPNGSTSNFKANGSVTIDSGSSIYQNYSGGSAGLIVGTDLVINGNLGLGTSTGDVTVGGNWTRGSGGTFSPNGRAAFFNGTGTQTVTVTGGGTETFNYLLVQGSGTLKLSTSTNITVSSSNGLTLASTNATSTIDLNGQTFTVSGGGNLDLSAGTRLITSTVTGGVFTISGATLTITNGGSLSFAATNTTLKLTNGFNAGSGLTTVNGTLQIDGGGFVTGNGPKYGAASLLKYNTTGIYGRALEWTAGSGTIGTTAGYPNDIQVSNNTTLNAPNTGAGAFSSNLALARDLTIDSGSAIYMDYGGGANKSASLIVGRNFSLSGALSLGSAVGGDMSVAGSWTNAGTFTPNSRAVAFNGTSAQTLTGATTFDYLTLNNSTGLTLQSTTSSIVITQTLTLTSGKITLGANNLTISSSNAIAGASTSNYIVTNSTGQLKRTVGGTAVAFAVGNSAYNPITFTNSGTSDVYGIRVVDGAITTGANNTKTVSRRWVTTEAVAGGSNLAVVAQYNTGEPNTGFAAATTPFIGFYNGTAWSQVAATAAGSNPFTFTSNANLSPSDLTAGTQYFALGKDNAFISVATNLVITAISPTSPTAGSGFNVTVQSQDAYGSTVNVVAGTSFALTTNGNAGAISGTTTGTIAAGTSSITVTGVILASAGTGVTLTATRTSGDVLTAGTSSTFTVLAKADHLTLVGVPSTGNVNVNVTSFTVEARRPDNTVDNTYTANVTITKISGPGALGGTITVAAVAGIATFSAAQFDTAGTYTISATSGSLTAAPTSGNIVITLAPVAVYTEDFGTSTTVALPYSYGTNATGSGFLNSRLSTPSWTQSLASANNAGVTGGAMSANPVATADVMTASFNVSNGYTLIPSSVAYSYRSTSTGPATLNITIADAVGNTSVSAVTLTRSGNFIATSSNFLSTTLELKGAITLTFNFTGSGGGSIRLDDVTLNGNVVCFTPTAYSVTGGGVYCPTGSGVAVGLSGSQSGINYQLKLNGVNSGSPVAGTGSALSFGNLTGVGTYTVVATNTNGSCNTSANMTGTAVITTSTSWTGGTSVAWTTASNWSCGVPLSSSDVTIGTGTFQPEITTNVTIANLTMNSSTTLKVVSTHNLTVTNLITNNGTITVENNANVLQANNVSNSGSGNMIVKRNSASIMRQDYTLWSSPVAGQNLLSFSPNTLTNRFYTYSPQTDQYVVVSSPSTTNFATGVGYLIRVANDHPTTPTIWSGQFTGTPNNGNVGISVNTGTYNAIGNPYPSTISADEFIKDNNLTEALYFWRKTNNTAQTSYATYTLAGGAGTGSNSGDPLGLVPNGTIQVGQGFIAKSVSTSLNFVNTQRIADNNNQFFRTTASDISHVWIDMKNTNGFASQMMVAYMDDATLGIDAAIDGHFFNDVPTALTSIIEGQEFTIQGRGLPFNTSEIIPLGMKSEMAGTYTISINHVDGLFDTNGTTIYLKDNLLGTIHSLNDSAYEFATEAGAFNTRFEIVFENLLAVNQPVFDNNQVVVYKQSHDIVINTGVVKMNKVQLYDIRGRLLVEQDHVNASELRMNAGLTNEVLIVKITSANNETVTKKIVN